MIIVAVASPVRRRNPAPDSAAPTSEWQRLSTKSGWKFASSERTTYSRWLATANALAVGIVAALVACERPREPVRTKPTDVGQWIWSSADSAHFVEAARSVPDLIPTVWIGTLSASQNGAVQGQLAR